MSTTSSFKRWKFKRQLEEIENKRSQDGSTCLISLYIPPGRVLSEFTNELNDEVGTAANIRSKTTKKNVTTALQVLIGKIKLMGPKSPESGLVLFSGVTTTDKVETFIIAPPNPVSRKLYVCDSTFHTEYLEEYLTEKEAYGLVVIDASTAAIAILKGNRLEILKTTASGAYKKHRAGGQSAVRFARLREEAVLRHQKRVADYLKDFFIEKDMDVKGIIIGGAGPIKDKFAQADFLDSRLSSKILKVVDIGYSADKEGLKELVAHSEEVLKGVRYLKEKELVQKWLGQFYQEPESVGYGEQEIRELLEAGAIDTLLLSERLGGKRVTLSCGACKNQEGVTTQDLEKFKSSMAKKTCKSCGSSLMSIQETRDLIDDLGMLAEESGAKIEIISAETEEGNQLKETFGGVAALLRYRPH